MVAGGLTFAVPGADPVFAEVSTSNPHLYVSAEGQDPDNMFAQGNIIEVIVRDDTIGDTDEGEAEPEVTVNGADLRMLQTANGDWRAYFAEKDALEDIDGNCNELDYGVFYDAATARAMAGGEVDLTDSDGVYFPPPASCMHVGGEDHPLIRETRSLTTGGNGLGQLDLSSADLWPFIQVFDFTSLGDVEIVYNKGGTREAVTLTFDDPSESHTIDRQKYPQRAHVHIELMDYALNIDPTDEDTWVFDTQSGAAYYNLFDEDGTAVNALRDTIINKYDGDAGIDETVSIKRGAQGNVVIDCQVTGDFGIKDANDASQDYLVSDDSGACVPNTGKLGAGADAVFTADAFAIGFVEDGSNNNVFINWAEDQRSNVVVRDDAPRGNSFEVDYSSPDAKSGVIGHFFAEFALDVPDDTWNSGERIDITLTDGDANINPLAEDDLTVANPDSLLIPSIRIGEPTTLASAGGVVWYDIIEPPEPDTTRPVLSIDDHTLQVRQGNAEFELPTVTCTDDGSTQTIQPSGTFDVTAIGDYTITYTCADPDNAQPSDREVTATITVSVVEEVTNTPPAIRPATIEPITATASYDLLTGVTCFDAEDNPNNPTPVVSDDGGFDSTTPDTYTVEYTCTDSDNESTSERRDITVNPLPVAASIAFDVTRGSWDNGNIELTIDGTATAVPGDIVLTTTIPGEEAEVTIPPGSDGSIDHTIILNNISIEGSYDVKLESASDSTVSATRSVTIPNILILDNVVRIGSAWIGDGTVDDPYRFPLRVTGSVGTSDAQTVALAAPSIDFNEDLEVGDDGRISTMVNLTSTGASGSTEFVLTASSRGNVAESDGVSASIPALFDVEIESGEWAEGSLTLTITGDNETNISQAAAVLLFPTAGDDGLAVSGFVANTTGIFGTATLGTANLAIAGETIDVQLVLGAAADGIKLPKTSVNIPKVLTLTSIDTQGTWNEGTLTLRVVGTESVSGDAVYLDAPGAEGFPATRPTVTGVGGTIGTTVDITAVSLSGDVDFRLTSSVDGTGAATRNVSVNIPSALTLQSVVADGTWQDGSLTLNVTGSELVSGDAVYLDAPDVASFEPVTVTGAAGTIANVAVETAATHMYGSTDFRLASASDGTGLTTQNVSVNIPRALELTSVRAGTWSADGASIPLSIEGRDLLLGTAAITLALPDIAAITPIAVTSETEAIFTTVTLTPGAAAVTGTIKFQLQSGSGDTQVKSQNVTIELPTRPTASSVDMAPTPISSSSMGFPPITRAVINDISEIPTIHNVVTEEIPTDKNVAYTWTTSVEQYSDRLRLHEPSADTVLDIGEDSAVVINWVEPTFSEGVTTMFNWDFGSLADHAEITGVYLGGDTQKVLLSTEASGLLHLDTTIQAELAQTGSNTLFITLNGNVNHLCDDITLVADFFTFGDGVNNAIYRIEVEESSSNSDVYEGTLEYTMLNQLNVGDPDTYIDLRAINSDVSMIVDEDFTDEDSVRVNYLDRGADGVDTQIAIQQAAPTHSAVVSFDSESYKIADTVTITLEDADLNVDNDVIDIYTFTPGLDTIGNDTADTLLLDVTFNDEAWVRSSTYQNATGYACYGEDVSGVTNDGFGSTGFTLQETAAGSGVFTGDFQIPNYYCEEEDENNNGKHLESVTGVDIEVNYQDFRDASGEQIEVGAGAAVRANTGTVSFDRTVYPVPFSGDAFRLDAVGNDAYLPQRNLTVHVTIDDADFDVSAAGEDVIANATEYLTVEVTRGPAIYPIDLESARILETAPNSGAFELDLELAYNDGPGGQILQGDILQVEYRDPTDASGEENSVTDSATFDLRNGVLQSDKSVYIIGSDMILTLIEPDFDLENDGAESYTLDLIEWDSDAATLGMGQDGVSEAKGSLAFDPEPSVLRETGDSTGIFQVIVEIPSSIPAGPGGDRLERGEEIELEYVDHGPSGADYVGDESEDVTLTVFTSNFGATIELDQKVYTWTDKVYITIVAPDHNFDSALVDEIGDSPDDPIQVSTRSADIDNYKLVETGPDTGIFTGEVILIGFDHNADGDTETGTEAGYDNPQRPTSEDGTGPTNGYLKTDDDDGITVSFEYSEDETVVGSALIRWNIGEVQWLESSYPASGTGVVRVIDPDMNWNPEAVNNFVVDVWSDADNGGIDLTVTETNEATGIFEGTVFFTITDESSGHRLRVAEGNTVTAEYEDNTLPDPYTTADELDITATTLIGTIVPPLERAPATNLRIVDAFGNSLDAVSADQQVQIVADLANGQDRSQAFAYLVQVQDANGVTVALSWISGTLEAGQSLSPSTSWIPSDAGTYTATAFVWESVDNPTALSPPVTTDITVS